MSQNPTRRIIIRPLLVLILSIGIFVFIFKKHLTHVYKKTIEPISFQDFIFNEDTTKNSTNTEQNSTDESYTQDQSQDHILDHHYRNKNSHPSKESSASKRSSASNNRSIDKENDSEEVEENTSEDIISGTLPLPKGREIKSSEIPVLHVHNTRVRLTTLLTLFKQGDYISGMEFSNLYRQDPTLGKLAKSTMCGFIEKHISRLTRSGNSFVIQTIDPKGIHTKLKIPFVEDLQINIDNGAQLVLDSPFTSTAPAFNKSILLPIQLKRINIVHNGEQFPTSGFISGDFYFVDYSKTKLAYKLN